ncbi:hypothetical protein D3C76_1303780 [compost metagenome]
MGKILIIHKYDAFFMQTPRNITERPVLIGNDFGYAFDEAFIQPGRGVACEIFFSIARPDLILNSCNTNAYEFIQIARDDRQKSGTFH